MKQDTFTDIEYSMRKRKPKREEFLENMDKIIPWDEWVGVIAPIIPEGSEAVHPWELKKCYECICFRSGSTSLTQQRKMPSMTAETACPCSTLGGWKFPHTMSKNPVGLLWKKNNHALIIPQIA